MHEDEYVEQITQLVKDALPKQYVPVQKANLYYQVVADNNLNIPADLKHPKRGDSAFQTDLCIFLKKNDILLPKIVIEFKRDITTHDVITYSNKAKRHKQIYPYLRYGLLSYGLSVIPKRFFIHNEGLDFYLATKEYTKNLQRELRRLIEQELKISDTLESTIFGSQKYDFYRTNIEFRRFNEP